MNNDWRRQVILEHGNTELQPDKEQKYNLTTLITH